MVVDTSAVLAILFGEPEAAAYAQSIENDPAPLISAASVFEAGIVLLRRHGPEALSDLQDLIEQSGMQIEPVTVEQADRAHEQIGYGTEPPAPFMCSPRGRGILPLSDHGLEARATRLPCNKVVLSRLD